MKPRSYRPFPGQRRGCCLVCSKPILSGQQDYTVNVGRFVTVHRACREEFEAMLERAVEAWMRSRQPRRRATVVEQEKLAF